MEAAANGHLETIKLLLTRGVDVNAKDKGNSSAYSEAKRAKHKKIVRLLKKAGAQASK